LRTMLQLAEQRTEWPTPIVRTVATDGTGVGELVESIAQHRAFLERSGTWRQRRADSARRQVRAIVEDRLASRFDALTSDSSWAERFEAIAQRQLDPYSVADDVLREVARDGE